MKVRFQRTGRILAAAVLSIIILWTAAFLIGRYGWKVQGFSACTVGDVMILEAEKNGSSLAVRGETSASLPAYVGYLTETEGDTLYLGVKFNKSFGFVKRDGSFQIELELPSGINRVVLKGNDGEKPVWESEQEG